MLPPLILASQSSARQAMLQAAGVTVEALPARIDEDTITAALLAEGANPRDIADTLAEMKAEKIARKRPDAVVIGSDQVLAFGGEIQSKSETEADALALLTRMSGKTHSQISAVVVYHEGQPVWRTVSIAKLTMRDASPAYLEAYVARNWSEIRHCVGAYQIEAEGARLFTRIDGPYHTVLGMPLLPLLAYLTQRGWIDG